MYESTGQDSFCKTSFFTTKKKHNIKNPDWVYMKSPAPQ